MCRFLVDTLFCVKWLAKLSIFIHTDILVLVSEFVVVVGADHCRSLWAHPCYKELQIELSECKVIKMGQTFYYTFYDPTHSLHAVYVKSCVCSYKVSENTKIFVSNKFNGIF